MGVPHLDSMAPYFGCGLSMIDGAPVPLLFFFFTRGDSIITDNIQGGKGGKGESQRLEPMSRRPDQPSPLSPVFFSLLFPLFGSVF